MNNDFEHKHVHKFYSEYSEEFNITRTKTWPKIKSFIKKYNKSNFLNIDFGCGNGRNLPASGSWIGMDYCRELLQHAKKRMIKCDGGCSGGCDSKCDGGCSGGCDSKCGGKCNSKCDGGCSGGCDSKCSGRCSCKCNSKCDGGCSGGCDIAQATQSVPCTHNKVRPEFVRGDCLASPFKSDTFDLILSIAVLHHLSTAERRLQVLKETHRILKNTGRVLLYVWNEETKKKSKFSKIEGKNYFVSFHGAFERYYYLYDEKELIEDCKQTGFCIEESGIEQESIYVILKKANDTM